MSGRTLEETVSLSKINGFYNSMLRGDPVPPVRMAGDLLFDGNNRMIAAQFANYKLDVITPAWTKTPAGRLELLDSSDTFSMRSLRVLP
jgi:hypothetical protein